MAEGLHPVALERRPDLGEGTEVAGPLELVVPMWFFWHDDRLLLFSRPDAVKVAHVRRGSPVLIHLEGGRFGNDVVVLNGTAEISNRSSAKTLADFRDAYEAKYTEAIADYGMSLDEIVELFSTAIVFTPERLLAW